MFVCVVIAYIYYAYNLYNVYIGYLRIYQARVYLFGARQHVYIHNNNYYHRVPAEWKRDEKL